MSSYKIGIFETQQIVLWLSEPQDIDMSFCCDDSLLLDFNKVER